MSGDNHNQADQRRTGVPLLDGAEWVDPDEHGPVCGCAGCYLTRDVENRLRLRTLRALAGIHRCSEPCSRCATDSSEVLS